jgi:hypothetical protein
MGRRVGSVGGKRVEVDMLGFLGVIMANESADYEAAFALLEA